MVARHGGGLRQKAGLAQVIKSETSYSAKPPRPSSAKPPRPNAPLRSGMDQLAGCGAARIKNADRIGYAEWRITNRMAVAAAIMINAAKNIPGFIDWSVFSRFMRPRSTPNVADREASNLLTIATAIGCCGSPRQSPIGTTSLHRHVVDQGRP